MKFGGYNEKAAERVNRVFSKLITAKFFLMLLALASLVIATGADSKFR